KHRARLIKESENRIGQRSRNVVGHERWADAANEDFLRDVAGDDEAGDGNALAGIDKDTRGDVEGPGQRWRRERDRIVGGFRDLKMAGRSRMDVVPESVLVRIRTGVTLG